MSRPPQSPTFMPEDPHCRARNVRSVHRRRSPGPEIARKPSVPCRVAPSRHGDGVVAVGVGRSVNPSSTVVRRVNPRRRLSEVAESGTLSGVDSWIRRHGAVPDIALAVVLAGVLIPGSVPLTLASSASPTTKVLVVAAIIIAQTTVAFRRAQPATAYGVCCAAMAVLVVVPSLTGLAADGFPTPVPAIVLPSALVFPVLLYSVAVYGTGRVPLVALLVAGLGAVLTAVRLSDPGSTVVPTGGPRWLIVCGALAAVVLAAWSLGRFRRFRADFVRALDERAQRAEADRVLRTRQAADQERARIAREMHDVVAHSLAIMVAQAEAGRMAAANDPLRGIAVLPIIADTGRAAMADMRSLLGILRAERDEQIVERTPTENEGGSAAPTGEISGRTTGQPGTASPTDPPATPQPGLVDIADLIARTSAAGLPVRLTETGTGTRHELGSSGELTAYRVVQEALTNVIRHAGAVTRIDIDLAWTSDEITIEITDDGAGAAGVSQAGAGQGLMGMRERVTAAGGRWTAGRRGGGGFQIVAAIPVLDRGVCSGAGHIDNGPVDSQARPQ
jgi:signal transduction histidine kinase